MPELDDFKRAVEVHAEAISKELAMVGVTPMGLSGVYLLDVPAVEEMGEEAGLPADKLRELRKEINEVLTAIGAKAEADIYVRAVRSREESELIDETTLRARYEFVHEHFDVSRLRQHVWIKQTSKLPNFSRLDWEILEKKSDDDYRRPEGTPVRFALLQVKTTTKNGDEYKEAMETFAVDENDLTLITLGIERLRKELNEGEQS